MNDSLIHDVFYNPETGYVGAKKIHERLKSKGVSMKEIHEFLGRQHVAQVNKKNNGKLGSYVPLRPLQEFQIDLVYLENKGLNNARYGMTAIDAFSKKADVVLMKKRNQTEAVIALREVFRRLGTPETIYVDEGSEFNNTEVKKLLREYDVELILTLKHAPMVERFNRTLKEMIDKYLQASDTKTITNILPQIVENYNSSYHSTIKMAPNDVNAKNQHEVWENIERKATHKNLPPLDVDDKVRVQLKAKSFVKGYKPKWSKQIHKIVEKSGRYYIVDDDDRKYLRAYLQKVEGDVEKPEIVADLRGTQEGHLKYLANRPKTRSVVQEAKQSVQRPKRNSKVVQYGKGF